jgi:hypothetical protein
MAFHIELRVNLVKTLQVPIFYFLQTNYLRCHQGDVFSTSSCLHLTLTDFLTSCFGLTQIRPYYIKFI